MGRNSASFLFYVCAMIHAVFCKPIHYISDDHILQTFIYCVKGTAIFVLNKFV